MSRSMARKSSSSKSKKPSARLRSFRRTRAFLWVNLFVALVVGAWYLVQPPARQAEVRLLVGNTFAANKNVSPIDVAWDIWQMYYSRDYVATPPAEGDRTFAYGGLPRAARTSERSIAGETPALLSLPTKRVLVNEGYVVGYADAWGNPLWAAYRMADISPLPPAGERPGSFSVDTRTAARISPEAYTGTGFDRGHLAPNYGIATRFGEAAQRETFLMSNIIPQRHGLNAGMWKQLEQRSATSYPARFGEVWVVVGPVFGARSELLPSRGGLTAPRVPEGCFMIITDESDGRVRTLAFLFPQEPGRGAKLEDFLTTIDEIQARTGLDFFPELSAETQAELESRRAARVW
jgi:endonuclease G